MKKTPNSPPPPGSQAASLSRRDFLRLAGMAAIGATAQHVPLVRSTLLPSSTRAAPGDLRDAIEIAREAPIFREAILELRRARFDFLVESGAVTHSSVQGRMVGLALPHTRTESQRFGASLLLTVDLEQRALAMAQRVVAWCYLELFQAESIIFDARKPLYEECIDPRVESDLPPAVFRPRIEQYWVFPRLDPPPYTPDDMPETGWPPELPGSTYWHTFGVAQAEWGLLEDAPVYHAVQLEERRADNPELPQRYDLPYDG